MKTAKIPKFRWGEISELNSGHTQNEWGMEEKESVPRTIVAYTVAWENQD